MVHMPVNLALVNLNLLHPVVTLCATSAVVLPGLSSAAFLSLGALPIDMELRVLSCETELRTCEATAVATNGPLS